MVRASGSRLLLLIGLAAAAFGLVAAVAGAPDAASPDPSATAMPATTARWPTPGPAASFTPGPPTPSTPPDVWSPTAAPAASGSPEGVVARRIRVDRLGIDLPIVEGDGIDAPLWKAAHYPGTAWPGAGSNIYLYGHAQKGMFLPLWDARPGDRVELELADGTVRAYLVDEALRVRWNALEYLEPTPVEQLTLQTSTSNTATAPRFVVIAYPEGRG